MAEQLSKKIIDWNIKVDKKSDQPPTQPLKPIERGEEPLTSTTYKTKTLDDFGFNITISDIVVDGVKRPYEIFFNTRDVNGFAHWMAIARLISAFFRTGYDYRFISSEMQQIFDPKGGYFKKGAFYNSFVAEVGAFIEKHFHSLAEFNQKKDQKS